MARTGIERCVECKENISGKPEDIEFVYNGMKFRVFKSGMECVECVKKQTIRNFKEFAQDFVSLLDDGSIKVDWSQYMKIREERRSDERINRINDILYSLGVFSLSVKGNWEIVTDLSSLNPRLFFMNLYFVKKEDAIKYARLRWGGTLYSWQVRHIDEIISKEDIMKE